MKILDEKPFGYEFECRVCKSRLLAEPDDVKIGLFGPNYGGERPSRSYYVDCPVCGESHVIERQFLTPKVRELADSKEKK